MPVHAFTIEELNIQIKILQEQIAALQNQLNELQEEEVANVPEEDKEEVVITQTAYIFTQNLRYGDTSTDVRNLKACLRSDPIVYPEGLATGYFGPSTKAAIIRFQEKYADEILKPLGLPKGTGFVGNSTRAKLNAICGFSSISKSTMPQEKPIMPKAKEELKTKIEPQAKPDNTTLDLCANVTCSVCHYCTSGKCVVRPDGYNDCGEGCQRCLSGSCQDYNQICITGFYGDRSEVCGNDQCKTIPNPNWKPIEFPKIENTPKTKGPCEGVDARDYYPGGYPDPRDRDFEKKYKCWKYLDALIQQDLENNPQLRKELQKVQQMPTYIPPQSLPKGSGEINPLK